ncbi:MAG: restriction endonuclease, partial [Burkholderiales bacterium]
MAVPDFQTFLRPMLEAVADGQPHKIHDLSPEISSRFKLTEADREDLLPSGKQTRFVNRVQWAATFLNAAKLVERKSRGVIAITERGKAELGIAPPKITVQYLMKYPEFKVFRGFGTEAQVSPPPVTEQSEAVTPAEQIEIAYQNIRKSLAIELLEKVKTASPSFFERLVVDLLVQMGYGGSRADAGQAIGKTGDGGIDGIIKEDRLGLDLVAIQAKRYTNTTVGRPDVQAFSGSLDGQGAKKGVFITTSQFSQDAKEYVKRLGDKKIILIGG